jgi:apolipoprotein N-acyltransferase
MALMRRLLFGALSGVLLAAAFPHGRGSILVCSPQGFTAEPFVLNFGWPTLGYAVAGRPVFAPFAATLGVYGISFLAFLLGTLKGRTLIIATVLWAVACLVRLPAPSPERPLTVTLVQATDEDTLFQLSSRLPSSHPKGSLLGGRAGVGGPDIILWPEHAFRSDPRVAGRLKFENYWPWLQALARESKAHLIFGAHVSKGKGEKDFENAAFVLAPSGELAGIHAKNHPVHFITDGIASTTAKAIPIALCDACDTLYSLGGWLFGPLCLVVSMGLIIGVIAWTKLHKLGS